jgi:hypothetical protein
MFELVDIKKRHSMAYRTSQMSVNKKFKAATAWSENHTAETGGNLL